MKILNVLFVCIGLATSVSASQSPSPARPEDSAVMSPENIAWVKDNFAQVKGKTLPVCVSTNGNILKKSETLTINNAVDYIRLLASDLVAAKSTNKMMLLEGFILMAIIQGDVFPVDYGNIAAPGTDNAKLLQNAAKIAAYGMTYRMGIHTTNSYGDGGIRTSTKPGEKKVFYVSDSIKKDYAYKTKTNTEEEQSLNRQSALKRLKRQQSLQARSLTEVYNKILSEAENEAPTDVTYNGMYNTKNVKRVDGGNPAGLPLAIDQAVDEKLNNMGIIGTAAPAGSSSRRNSVYSSSQQ